MKLKIRKAHKQEIEEEKKSEKVIKIKLGVPEEDRKDPETSGGSEKPASDIQETEKILRELSGS